MHQKDDLTELVLKCCSAAEKERAMRELRRAGASLPRDEEPCQPAEMSHEKPLVDMWVQPVCLEATQPLRLAAAASRQPIAACGASSSPQP